MEINSVITALKEMSQDSSYKIYVPGQLPMDVTFQLNEGATLNELEQLNKLNYTIPKDYLRFLNEINGATLFDDGKYIQKCKIYSIQEMFHWRKFLRDSGFFSNWDKFLPILDLQDIGQLMIDLERYENKEDYLLYPDESNHYFHIGFTEWLNNYLVTNGSEFWYIKS